MMNSLEITIIERFADLSLDALLKVWLIPKTERHLLRMEKRLSLNGEIPNYRSLVKSGDIIRFQFKENTKPLSPGEATLCQVLYEDQNLIVVNKVENMKTHANIKEELALQNHVSAYCRQAVYVVHRLDFETSGAILFAKNQFVLPILGSLLEQRQIHREYEALVSGHFPQKKFSIDKKIGKDRHDSKKRIVSQTGQTATTQVEVLKSLKQFSLVNCRLETGRSHQIRVHLSSLGHPILGDRLYGGKNFQRMMLHAKRMKLTLPFTFEKIEVIADSSSFEQALNSSKIMMK